MSRDLKYDEFFFRRENRIVSIMDINNNYLYYQNEMFCPDCHRAELSFVNNTNKTPHLRTKQNSTHAQGCSYSYSVASNKTIIKYFTNLNSEQIENKLNSMMRYLCVAQHTRNENTSSNNTEHNPMLIKTRKSQETKEIQAIKRKSFNIAINEKDLACICVFYGKVKLSVEEIIQDKKHYAFLKIFAKNKQKFNIYIPKHFIPKDIETDTEYNFVAIGTIKNISEFLKIELLLGQKYDDKSISIQYQKC